jgi:hypothetical protein
MELPGGTSTASRVGSKRSARFSRGGRRGRAGVSEVIANVLILGITTVVFASIFYWVSSMRGPPVLPDVAVKGSLQSDGNFSAGSEVYVNLSHLGGSPLSLATTIITVSVDGVSELFTFADGAVASDFTTGTTWRYAEPNAGGRLATVSRESQVWATLLDTATSAVVWNARLLPSENLFGAQVFGGASPGVVCAGSADYRIWVRVATLEGEDIASVAFRSPFPSPPGLGYDDWTPMFYNFASDRWERVPTTLLTPGRYSYDVRVIESDGTAATRTVRFTVADCGGGGGGGGGGGDNPVEVVLKHRNGLQRYDIFNATEWDQEKFNATSTRDFRQGETVVVIVASKFLENIEDTNTFNLWDPYAAAPLARYVHGGGPTGPLTTPSSTKAFRWYESHSGYLLYQFRFATKCELPPPCLGVPIPIGRYPLDFELKASFSDPPDRFATSDNITVFDPAGTTRDYPKLELFRDAGLTVPATKFNFTETAWVKLTTGTVDGSIATVQLSDVSVTDFLGGTQIMGSPGASPMGPLALEPAMGAYKFSIDLVRSFPDLWLVNANDYALRISHFLDSDESYDGILSAQIEVLGPRWHLDLVAGMTKETIIPPGVETSGLFYDQDRNWARSPLAAVSLGKKTSFPKFNSVRFADMDRDGDLDVVAGAADGRVLWWDNFPGDGSDWDYHFIDDATPGSGRGSVDEIVGLDAGRIDSDLDFDVAIGTGKGDVFTYTNDGLWTARYVGNVGNVAVQNIYIRDLDGDGCSDLAAAAEDGAHLFRNLKQANACTGLFGSLLKSYYPPDGTIADASGGTGTVSGTYSEVLASDDSYQTVQEVASAGNSGTYSYSKNLTALTEITGGVAWESVAGSYTNTRDSDGVYYTLTEGQYDPNSNQNRYSLGNTATGGTTTCGSGTTNTPTTKVGHVFHLGTLDYNSSRLYRLAVRGAVTSPAASAENLLIGWSNDCRNPWYHSSDASWYLTGGSPATVYANLSATTGAEGTEFQATGGYELFVHVIDSDGTSNGGSCGAKKGDKDTDCALTSFGIDYIALEEGLPALTSVMDKAWLISGIATGGTSYMLRLEANHTASVDGDRFQVSWGYQSGGACSSSWNDLLRLSKTADNDVDEIGVLPLITSSDICVRIDDTNRVNGNLSYDRVFVDRLAVERQLLAPNVVYVPNLDGVRVLDIGLGDLDADGDLDMVQGATNGHAYVFVQTSGFTWTQVNDLDLQYQVHGVFTGNLDSDSRLDFVVAQDFGKVVALINPGSPSGAWSAVTIDGSASGSVMSVEVGDVDGDWLDDVAVVTSQGQVMWYRHVPGGSWDRRVLDSSATRVIWDLSLGDASMGVTWPWS